MGPDVAIEHMPNGWTTDDMLIKYLTWLSQRCHGERLLLIPDVCKAHRKAKPSQGARYLVVDSLSGQQVVRQVSNPSSGESLEN
jgi:hypothetical protein